MQLHRTLMIFVCATACSLPVIAQGANGGEALLGGLKETPGPTLAEMKARDGMPKLVWGESHVNGKGRRSSRMEDGYLVMKNGTRLKGQVSVHAIFDPKKSDTWQLTEFQFREAKGQKTQKIPASEVDDFGLDFTIADYTADGKKVSKDTSRNFHPGIVKLSDGTEMRGMVALHSQFGDGIPGGGARELYYAENETANIQSFRGDRVDTVTQTREDGEFEYRVYRRAFMPVLVNGKNFLMFRNPYPTGEATGFLAGLEGIGAGVARDQASKAAAKGVVRSEFERRTKNGQDPFSAAVGAGRAGSEAGNAVAGALSGIEIGSRKPEYVIRNVKTGVEVIVSDATAAANMAPLVSACSATASMSDGQRKDLVKLKNIESLVRTLDQCF